MTLTVDEYRARPAVSRLLYRIYRHPLVLFAVGPACQFLLLHRIPRGSPTRNGKAWLSVLGTNAVLAAVAAVVVLQLVFTYALPFQAMFGNEAVPFWVWPWLIAGGLVFFLVVEAEKLVIRSSETLRRSVTAIEAGG